MIERVFGVMRRAYYLYVVVTAVLVLTVGTMGAMEYGKTSDVVGCILYGILSIPAARLLHMTAHWVIWGKFK